MTANVRKHCRRWKKHPVSSVRKSVHVSAYAVRLNWHSNSIQQSNTGTKSMHYYVVYTKISKTKKSALHNYAGRLFYFLKFFTEFFLEIEYRSFVKGVNSMLVWSDA